MVRRTHDPWVVGSSPTRPTGPTRAWSRNLWIGFAKRRPQGGRPASQRIPAASRCRYNPNPVGPAS
jgi:hypothetical protein